MNLISIYIQGFVCIYVPYRRETVGRIGTKFGIMINESEWQLLQKSKMKEKYKLAMKLSLY